ncbi:MAG: NADH-quinone oxidoreductase subunit NuoH [Anaerolineales bacterium]|jgi:NADH-quinone oxidoreductase subunit H|nr:NADH-quinone oxidoreductase subunit NuoH [Anaerolineales bacterium]
MGDPVTNIANWLENLLISLGLSDGLVTLILAVIGVVVIASVVLILDIFLVWLERKVVARFQDRLGPNRVGPYGLIQPIADVIKLLIKEDILPVGADKIVYNLAPIIALATVLLIWAVLPISATSVGTSLNVGLLYIVAIGALSTLGIIMAGWASNNKYALLGAFRTVAQMVSYEVPMVIAMLVPVILARSMGMTDIVEAQDGVWFIVVAPVTALIVLITSIAELGRTPFDLIEAESEIVAGFHIEYTGMKFGLFYAGELLHALTVGAIFSTLFLGGWRGPGAETYPILGIFYFFIKAFFLYWVIMWVKYSLPRIRIDHMLSFNWKFLTPLALVVLMVTAILEKVLINSPTLVYTSVMLGANLVIIWITVLILRSRARIERQRVAEVQPTATPENSSTTPIQPPVSTTS